MSTTVRYSIKPKNVSLLELCQSFNDFRHPPPAVSSYQYQSSSNTAQILTRRLFLHPLTINANTKQQTLKLTTAAVTPPDLDQSHRLNSEESRESKDIQHKSSHRGLVVFSSTLPLTSRIHPKIDTRHFRDKTSINLDEDNNSDLDTTTISICSNPPPSLPPIVRHRTSNTRKICTHPSCVRSHQKIQPKRTRWEKVDVWNHLNQTLLRPIPNDPPTTPLDIASDFYLQNNEQQEEYLTYNSIQETKLYKRNVINDSVMDE